MLTLFLFLATVLSGDPLLGSAPLSKSIWTTMLCPKRAAPDNGVTLPYLLMKQLISTTRRVLVLVLQEVALGAEGHGAVLAAEWPLHVVDVDVEPQLRSLREHLLANAALRLPIGPRLDDVLVAVKSDGRGRGHRHADCRPSGRRRRILRIGLRF